MLENLANKTKNINEAINNNSAKYVKFALMSAVYLFMTYVENNGKALLIDHGLVEGNALQITKDFFTLNWGALPSGIKLGLMEILVGYTYVFPVDMYLGSSAFRWTKKKAYEIFGPEHYLNRPLSELISHKNH